MAKPGQSEAQQRMEREHEIRAKMSQLKNSGRMKGGSESMIAEAENFMNQESPLRKFEKRVQERKAAKAAEEAKQEQAQMREKDKKDEDTLLDGTSSSTDVKE